MKILVLAKQVPDVSKVTFDSKSGRINREGVPLSFNSFDKKALEEAIRIKEKTGSTVMVVSMGPPQAAEILNESLRMGADEAYLITDRKFGGSDTWVTSKILSHFIKQKTPDLVLCGKYSLDGETSQVPPQTATMCNYSFVSSVSRIDFKEDGSTVTVEQDHEKGSRMVEASIPLVLSVSEKINRARKIDDSIPQMKDKIQHIDANKLGLDINGLTASLTVVSGTEVMKSERSVTMIPMYQIIEKLNVAMGDKEKNKKITSISLNSKTESGFALGIGLDDPRTTMEIASKISELCFGRDMETLIIGNVEPNKLEGMAAHRYIYFNSSDHESIAKYLGNYILENKPQFVVFPSNTQGRDTAGTLSAILSLGLTADCVDLKLEGNKLIQYKPAFGGGVVARIESNTKPEMATVRPGIFKLKYANEKFKLENTEIKEDGKYKVINDTPLELKYKPLQSSSVVIGIGRGVKGKNKIDQIVEACEKLNISVGATRPVVDMRMMPRQQQIGLTGFSISPDLYIALGVSGQDNHIVGLRYAKTIISINNDENASIFKYSDFGLVGDVDLFISELEKMSSSLLP
jgi:electron transfer flavoprotein alpha subunit